MIQPAALPVAVSMKPTMVGQAADSGPAGQDSPFAALLAGLPALANDAAGPSPATLPSAAEPVVRKPAATPAGNDGGKILPEAASAARPNLAVAIAASASKIRFAGSSATGEASEALHAEIAGHGDAQEKPGEDAEPAPEADTPTMLAVASPLGLPVIQFVSVSASADRALHDSQEAPAPARSAKPGLAATPAESPRGVSAAAELHWDALRARFLVADQQQQLPRPNASAIGDPGQIVLLPHASSENADSAGAASAPAPATLSEAASPRDTSIAPKPATRAQQLRQGEARGTDLSALSSLSAHAAVEGQEPEAPLPFASTDPAAAAPIAAGAQPANALVAANQASPIDPPNRPLDFAALVDRLVDARQSAQATLEPRIVSTAIHHADFGQVSLQFRHDAEGLSVTMAGSDPDLARAVQAATPAGTQMGMHTGGEAGRHAGTGGESSGQARADGWNQQSTASGQTASQGQHQRGATAQRAGERPTASANPSTRPPREDSARGGIFA